MRAYILRRLLLIIPTLLIITLVVFVGLRFIPGDAVDIMVALTPHRTGEEDPRVVLRRELGLDQEVALISIVGLVEIMRTAALGASSTKEPFTFYITAFFLFLFLASLSNQLFQKAEKVANRGIRRD